MDEWDELLAKSTLKKKKEDKTTVLPSFLLLG